MKHLTDYVFGGVQFVLRPAQGPRDPFERSDIPEGRARLVLNNLRGYAIFLPEKMAAHRRFPLWRGIVGL